MNYYQQTIEEVWGDLDSSPQGLSSDQVKERLKKYGPNTLEAKARIPAGLRILFNQFSNIFFILLALASLISFYLHEIGQLIILAVVMTINVLVGFAEEYKAERALRELKKELTHWAQCLRDGRLTRVPAGNLVPGDVVVLKEGDRVSADLRIIQSQSLQVNQAVLTGESLPVIKTSAALASDCQLPEQTNMVFAGTSVWSGKAQGIVTATGNRTQIGQIAGLVEEARVVTPLEARLHSLARFLLAVVAVAGVIVFGLGWLSQQMALGELLTFVIALLVSAVPESLPTILVLTLAVGVVKMARQKSIVKRLPAVEALGDVDVICTDKTGTLTKNEMTVVEAVWLDKGKILSQNILGAGFEARPKFKPLTPSLKAVLETGALANDTVLEPLAGRPDQFSVLGDPTEGAVLVAAEKAGINIHKLRQLQPFDDEIAFDSRYKYEAALSGGKIAVMGALEILLNLSCLQPKIKSKILSRADLLAQQGLRIVGIFEGKKEKDVSPKLNRRDIKDLKFLGLVAMMDPVREGIKEALAQVEKAGIEVKIVTGDLSATALTLAHQIGMKVRPSQLLTGEQLAKIPLRGLEKKVKEVKIFARVTPQQKFRIIQALQLGGQIVGVTGDGVNDAPALKQAEIGIAMGKRGTEVAKEAADLVLLDDSFATIVQAVGLGRQILFNIKKFVTFLLSCNFVELFLVAIAFTAGLPVPFLTVQILWINLVTDTFPALALAFEKGVADILPKSKSAYFLRPIIGKALVLSLIGLALELIIFISKLPQGVEYARTMVFNLAIFFELMVVFSIRSDQPFWKSRPFSNLWLIGAVLLSAGLQLITFLPGLSDFFGVARLSWGDFGLILVTGAIGFVLAEGIKLLGFWNSPYKPGQIR